MVLEVEAVIVATVKDVHPMQALLSTPEIFDEVKRLAPLAGLKTPFQNRQLKAFAGSLLANDFSSRYSRPLRHLPSPEQAEEVLLDVLLAATENDMQVPPNEVDRVMRRIVYNCVGRSFYNTQEGCLGVAPAAARVGDGVDSFPPISNSA